MSTSIDRCPVPDVLSVQQTDANTKRAHEKSHFVLDKVETHGQQRKSNEKVQSTKDQLLLRRPRVETCTRHVVAETDRRQRDETERETDEEVPVVFVTVSCQLATKSTLH